jgi:hypothetical protein
MIPYAKRLFRPRTPAQLARAVRRELELRVAARSMDARIAEAADSTSPVVVGPFLSEVGFEVLYWLPFVRRVLGRHGIERDRVVAVSRGGADPWYRDMASTYVDVLDVMSSDEFAQRMRERRRGAGDQKQLRTESVDVEVLDRVRDRLGFQPQAQVHPSLMFLRQRHTWSGDRSVRASLPALDLRPMPSPDSMQLDLPDEFIVVKAYSSSCLPPTPANRAYLEALVRRLAERTAVVVLAQTLSFEDHEDFDLTGVPGVRRLAELRDPRSNLAMQSQAIARSSGLVSTYGGFSYLAVLLGIPAVGVFSERNFNPVHRDVLDAARAELALPDLRLLDTTVPAPEGILPSPHDVEWSGAR